ncbi:MAG: phage major capsid protein [Clostridiales bacterium]|nr:phage major capsid protein [Clostridiales bacterium]
MVTINSAQDALKSAYLSVVSEALNVNANPLLAKINQTTNDVWGKEIIKLTSYGVNGGIGAGSETGDLPSSAGNNYVKFVSSLKNLYGTIEISDKAIRASETNAGAFVNLLNAEMEGLIKASNYNFGRMLFGDGSGKLANVVGAGSNYFTVDSIKFLIEGLKVDYYKVGTVTDVKQNTNSMRIVSIDRANKRVYFDCDLILPDGEEYNYYLTVQNSKDLELTGLGAIFKTTGSLYGVDRTQHNWMMPVIKEASENKLTEDLMQSCIDELEEVAGSNVDYITCSSDVKRLYQKLLTEGRKNIDIMDLQGGYKAISYNGIPVVSDRFVEDGTMYLLNTKDFELHQLCDWRWLEDESGRIIRQKAGFPSYTATLVKYADLICSRPNGQAKITGITTI